MKSTKPLLAFLIAGSGVATLACIALAHPTSPHPKPRPVNLVKDLDGYKVRVVAVGTPEFSGMTRQADHAWTPDGVRYEGAEARLRSQNYGNSGEGGTRRTVFFEIQPPLEKEVPGGRFPTTPPTTGSMEVLSYLPESNGDSRTSGPVHLDVYHGITRDSSGAIILGQPLGVAMQFGTPNTGPQPLAFGIAHGEYTTVAKGTASLDKLAEGETRVFGSGSWGRVEGTRLKMPTSWTSIPNTHQFTLLGEPFPPKTERRVMFYDSKGRLVARCGDGPSNAGYARWGMLFQKQTVNVASFEVQERPCDFVQFDGISFDAPPVNGYKGKEGEEHKIETSLGEVFAVLENVNDGPWAGSSLFAADGTRWNDPAQDLNSQEYGMFDPWNHPLMNQWHIMMRPDLNYPATATPTSCEIYAADSPDGPDREKLTVYNQNPFTFPISAIPCTPTKRPYIRLAVSCGDGDWKTLKTIPVNDELLKSADAAPLGTPVLNVNLFDTGIIRIAKGGNPNAESEFTPKPGTQRIRVAARMRDGKTREANFNTSGFSGSVPGQNQSQGLSLSKQSNGILFQSGPKSFEFKDVASFEIQVQDYKPPVSILLHSPIH